MPETPRLALPLLTAGQTQKDVTHNDALLAIDRLLLLTVESRSLASPPGGPVVGKCYIVPAAGAAAWGQPAGTLMYWQGATGWLPVSPRDGQVALVADDGVMVVYRGGWQAYWPVAGLSVGGRTLLSTAPATIAPASGGSVVDVQARSTLAALILAMQNLGLLAP